MQIDTFMGRSVDEIKPDLNTWLARVNDTIRVKDIKFVKHPELDAVEAVVLYEEV